jgi:hypothetical protein
MVEVVLTQKGNSMTTPYEQHEAEKKKVERRRNEKQEFDHVKRTEKVRRFAAGIRDHVKGFFGK